MEKILVVSTLVIGIVNWIPFDHTISILDRMMTVAADVMSSASLFFAAIF